MRTVAAMFTLLSVSLAGCSGDLSPGDLDVRTDQRAYFVPDIARVTVRNDWQETLYLSSCSLLEGRAGSDWLPAEEFVCPDDLIVLGPGETHQFVRGLQGDVVPGLYRVRVPVYLDAPFRHIDEAFASKGFTVTQGQPRAQ